MCRENPFLTLGGVRKRGGSYTCIITEHFKFLDVISYLAAGTSLDGFLKAFSSHQDLKSYWPYEWFRSLQLLNSYEFPPYTALYSSLKQRNTLEPLKNETISADEIVLIGRIPTMCTPLSESQIVQIAESRYYTLRSNFVDNNWSMRNYLTYNNNQ